MSNKKVLDGRTWLELRQIANLSSKAVCDYTGLSRQFLFNIEKGKSKPSEQNENKILALYALHLKMQKQLYSDKLEKINSLINLII